jgi:hypothetical protein
MSLRRWKGKLQRFVRLDTEDRLLLLRAVFWIGVARLWLAAFPFQRLASRLSAEDGLDDADPELVRRIGNAVGAAGAHVPWRSDCFPRSIAAHQLLKSHGYASTIHLGVEKAGNGELLGHAWVTCGGIVVTGGEQLDRYAEIHRLGAARPKVTLGE